jgi:hypothetical protein
MKLIKQPLIYGNVKNVNGRIYTQEAIDTIKNQYSGVVSKGRALGELGHPEYNFGTLHNVSHSIEAIYQDGDVLYGDIKILDTPQGAELRNLYDAGEIVFRPRSAATVNKDGTVDILQIYSFDAIYKSHDAWKGIEIEEDNQKMLLLIG